MTTDTNQNVVSCRSSLHKEPKPHHPQTDDQICRPFKHGRVCSTVSHIAVTKYTAVSLLGITDFEWQAGMNMYSL